MKSYCVAIDPGGTTGIAMIESADRPWDIGVRHLGPDPHHLELFTLLKVWNPEYIVCESFQNRGSDPAELTSCEYIGIVRLYQQRMFGTAAQNHPVVVWQASALVVGTAFWGKDRLRAYNLYVPGYKHGRDAIRHYAYWRTFTLGDKDVIGGVIRPSVRPL